MTAKTTIDAALKERMVQAVEESTGVHRSDWLDFDGYGRRKPHRVIARTLLACLMRESDTALKCIARELRYDDHSTVVYLIQKHNDRLDMVGGRVIDPDYQTLWTVTRTAYYEGANKL